MIRPFVEDDRPAVELLGDPIIESWAQHGCLHLVAGDPLCAQLQIIDRSTTPLRRPGRFEMRLFVAPDHRRAGIGNALWEQALVYAVERGGRSIRAAFTPQSGEDPAHGFLARRGFVELQRYHPSELQLDTFRPEYLAGPIQRCQDAGVRFFSYADAGDSEHHRRQLYHLSTVTHDDIPVLQTEPHECETFESWLNGFLRKDASQILIAEVDGEWVGLVDGLEWPFTGVLSAFRGRGIATALKVIATTRAAERNQKVIHTENHQNNLPMMAINRKLGFIFGPVEIELIRWLHST